MEDQVDLRENLDRFYAILDSLAHRLGGTRILAECDGRMEWPNRGIYFFFEPGERRGAPNGSHDRVVRVGTHAISADSKTTLWDRLKAHRGAGAIGEPPGGGNHRGSVFRKHVGTALLMAGRYAHQAPERWGVGSSAPSIVIAHEEPVERLVSEYIGRMPFLWLEASDEPSSTSTRNYIERNSIGLLTRATAVDPPSDGWLGRHSADPAIRSRGLWNVRHVDEAYDPEFFSVLERLAKGESCPAPMETSHHARPAQTIVPPVLASNKGSTLALVACAKSKAAYPCPAEQLYQPSSQFRATYEYARRVAAHTLILSAKHGLLRPETVTAPYEQTLVGASSAVRKAWSATVHEQLRATPEYLAATTVVWLAGVDYRAFLLPMVKGNGKECVVPMEGLTQGRQKTWLKASLAGPAVFRPSAPSASCEAVPAGVAKALLDAAPRASSPPAEELDPELMALIVAEWERDSIFRTLGPRSMPNRVTAVKPSAVYVQTERSLLHAGGPAEVPAWMLNLAWRHLRAHGELSGSTLLRDLRVHRSSAVCAILARLPGVRVSHGDGIGLIWGPR